MKSEARIRGFRGKLIIKCSQLSFPLCQCSRTQGSSGWHMAKPRATGAASGWPTVWPTCVFDTDGLVPPLVIVVPLCPPAQDAKGDVCSGPPRPGPLARSKHSTQGLCGEQTLRLAEAPASQLEGDPYWGACLSGLSRASVTRLLPLAFRLTLPLPQRPSC